MMFIDVNMIQEEEDGTKADKVVIIAVVIGAMTISAVVINKGTAVVLYATTSIRAVDRRLMAPIRGLAVDNLATRDGYRLLVDKVALHFQKSTTVVYFVYSFWSLFSCYCTFFKIVTRTLSRDTNAALTLNNFN